MKLFFIFFLLVIFISCSKKSTFSEYIPNCGVGSKSTYSVEMLSLMGKQTGQCIYRIDEEKVIDEKKYIKEIGIYTGIPGVSNEVNYFRYAQEGIYKLNEEDQSEQIIYPLPLEIGSTWTTKETKTKINYTVEKFEDVYFPDKTFEKCLKIVYEGKPLSINGMIPYPSREFNGISYLARGIGLIKNVHKESGVVIEMTLIESDCE